MSETTTKSAHYGYKLSPNGAEQIEEIFLLLPGEKLPEGWSDKSFPGHHPAEKAEGIKPPPAKLPDGKPMAAPQQGDLGKKLEEAGKRRPG